MTIDAVLTRSPVISVVVLDRVEDAVPLAKALVAGGCPTIEMTLRTPAGLPAIAAIAREVPEALIGSGTVLTRDEFDASVEAGAQFAVSPGSTPRMLAHCQGGPIPYLPAVATGSELMMGLEAGYSAFKFFPAGAAGGVALLKALSGPFPSVRFCPTGGVDLSNAADYLALPAVSCVGGSWLTPKSAIAARDWGAIEKLARAAADALQG